MEDEDQLRFFSWLDKIQVKHHQVKTSSHHLGWNIFQKKNLVNRHPHKYQTLGIYWNGRVQARLNIFRISQYWDILNYTVCNISSEVCMIAVKHIYNCFISTNISCLLVKTESKPYIKTSPCSLNMYMTVTDSVLIVQLTFRHYNWVIISAVLETADDRRQTMTDDNDDNRHLPI